MRDYAEETKKRVAFIRERLEESGCRGIVFGNSGGKDSALVGILCKMACDDTLGVLLPCATAQNYGSDTDDALLLAARFGIASRTVDLTETRDAAIRAVEASGIVPNAAAVSNIAPRLRMTALYAVAASEGRLVAGTGNRSELYMGYFTKWGDGAADFNPIADLRDGGLRISRIPGRSALHSQKGSLRRALRGADRREGDGRELCGRRPLYGRRRGRTRGKGRHRPFSPRQRAQTLGPLRLPGAGSVGNARTGEKSSGSFSSRNSFYFRIYIRIRNRSMGTTIEAIVSGPIHRRRLPASPKADTRSSAENSADMTTRRSHSRSSVRR